MNNLINEISVKVNDSFKKVLGKDLLFVWIYGSWAFGLNDNKSDVDIVAVCAKYSSKQMREITSFIVDLHKHYGLELDEEVPYRNKLLVTKSFSERAIFADGFEKKKGHISIPPVIKVKKFLHSEQMALRLFLNAIATKNIFCGGDYEQYKILREKALRNYVRIFYSTWNIDRSSVDYFVKHLIDGEGKTGQLYIGFDNTAVVSNYLRGIFNKVFNDLYTEGYMTKINNEFLVKNKTWFEEINQKLNLN